MQKNLVIKLSAIMTLCVIFLIGMAFIKGLVTERQSYHTTVMSQIKQTHVDTQILATPFLLVQDKETSGAIFASHSTINTHAKVRDDQYKRGIYSAISYHSTVSINQTFTPTNEIISFTEDDGNISSNTPSASTQATTTTEKIPSKPLTLIIALKDLRGITPTEVNINGKNYPAIPDVNRSLDFSYLQVILPITYAEFATGSPLNVSFELQLSGIESFGIMPIGDNISVGLQSNWHSPKFYGAALPTEKSLTNTGFNASWQPYIIAKENQTHILCQFHHTCPISDSMVLMTDFVQEQDVYTLTDRTIKYALLLIMICFGTFFLFETIKRLRIHPIQYGLVASGLLVFYVLLLSLAEHIAFSVAYMIASVACVGLIGWYTYYVLASIKRAVGFTFILGSLYAGFYMVLSASGFNLLLGAIFCFVLVAITMYTTRHIDWYHLQHQITPSSKEAKTQTHTKADTHDTL